MTVTEMIAMANQYPSTGLGVIPTNNSKLPFEMILSNISAGEEVVLAFGANAGSIGRAAYQLIAVAFTNKRLLIAGKPNSLIGSFMSAGVKSINLDKVNSVGVFGMMVRVDTIGDEDCAFGSYAVEVRERLSLEIQKVLNQYHSATTVQNQNVTNIIQKSAAEQIKEYKELLDLGIITQEEFNAKKSQLLGGTYNDTNTLPNVQRYVCPKCGASVSRGEAACRACGQPFSW